MTKVYATYKETRAGRIALQYAADLSRIFGGQPLTVLVAHEHDAPSMLCQLNSRVFNSVRARLREIVGADCQLQLAGAGSASLRPGAVLVDPEPREDASCHCVFPANERAVLARRHGPLVVTFSDGDTGLVAATAAFDILARARAAGSQLADPDQPEIVFYHTTWRDPDAHSEEPIDQMAESAARVMLALEAAAAERGIRSQTIIETHDQVAQGVIEAANKAGAVMIVMDRSEQVSQGSYVDRVLEQSPIPVFVAAPSTSRLTMPAVEEEYEAFLERRRQIAASAQEPQPESWLRKLWGRVPVFNPVFAMSLVAAMYVYKLISKVFVGSWIASPTLVADGFHNAADFLQALIVILVVLVARRPSNERYHYGRQNIEWAASAFIGVLLFVTALKFTLDCALGFLSYAPAMDTMVRSALPWLPSVEQSNLTGSSFPWLLCVSLSSIALSFAVSRYQIFVGNQGGHQSMIADGEETRSDGWIETVTVIGLVAEYLTGWRVIEYGLGLFVAYLICGTAWELCQSGWHVMMQHSLGGEVEGELKAALQRVPGVEAVTDLKTFQVGHTAFVQATIESMARSAATPYVLKAARCAMRQYLLDPARNFKGARLDLNLERPSARETRHGFALCVDSERGRGWVATSLMAATDLAVCDLEHDEIVRTKLIPLAGKDVPALLLEKRLHRLAVMKPEDEHTQAAVAEVKARASRTRQAHVLPDTQVVQATHYSLAPLNIRIHKKGSSTVARALA